MSPPYSSIEMDIPDTLLKFTKTQDLERPDLKLKMGIEIHATIDSDWKAFSRTKANSNSLTSLGLLGVLPQINTGAIRAALKVSKMLNCEPPLEIGFERKSYFYFDLPRGYQLTQFLNPMGKNGYIFLPKSAKKINIFSVALEEDTAAYTQDRGVYTLAPERLGVPLVEISTHPDFETIDELIECVKWIRLLLFYLKISRAEFEKGKLRVDLNISLINKYDEAVTGRVEVKNLASYSAISNSARSVWRMLVNQLESNSEEVMKNVTCGWISDAEKLEVTREKKSRADYFFVPESSIPLIKLDRKELQQITKNCNQNYLTELYDTINSSGLADRERDEITHSYNFFWECFSFYKVLKDWKNSFFILKMAKSEGWKENSNAEVLAFLGELANSLRAEKPGEELKFNKWKLKECIGKIIKSGLQTHEAKNLYYSLPTVKSEDIVDFCKKLFVEKKSNLMKLIDREDKLSSYLLGQVRAHFKDQVEMSEAQEIVSSNLSKWKEDFSKIEEAQLEPKVESILEGQVKEDKKSEIESIQKNEEIEKEKEGMFKKKEKRGKQKAKTKEGDSQEDLVESKARTPKKKRVVKLKQTTTVKKNKPKEIVMSYDWKSFTTIPVESATPLGRKPKKKHWRVKKRDKVETTTLPQSKKEKISETKTKTLMRKKTTSSRPEKTKVEKKRKILSKGIELAKTQLKTPKQDKVKKSIDSEVWKSYDTIPEERLTPLGRKPKKKWKVKKSKTVKAHELPRKKKPADVKFSKKAEKTKSKQLEAKAQIEKNFESESSKIKQKTLRSKKVNKKREEQLHSKALEDWKSFKAIPEESSTPLGRKPKKQLWKIKKVRLVKTQQPSSKRRATASESPAMKEKKVKRETPKIKKEVLSPKKVNKKREELLHYKALEEWKRFETIPVEHITPLGRKPKKKIWKTKIPFAKEKTDKVNPEKATKKKPKTKVAKEKSNKKRKVKKEAPIIQQKTSKPKSVNKTSENQLMSKASEKWKAYEVIPEERSTPLGRKPKRRRLKRKKS